MSVDMRVVSCPRKNGFMDMTGVSCPSTGLCLDTTILLNKRGSGVRSQLATGSRGSGADWGGWGCIGKMFTAVAMSFRGGMRKSQERQIACLHMKGACKSSGAAF